MRRTLIVCALALAAVVFTVVNSWFVPSREMGVSTADAGAPPVIFRIDCDLVAVGVQTDCSVPGGVSTLSVEVVLEVAAGANFSIGAIGAGIVDPNPARLSAVTLPCSGQGISCNPDFLQENFAGTWLCDSPYPSADLNPVLSEQQSYFACYAPQQDGPAVLGPATIRLGRVLYEVPSTASAGTVDLSLFAVSMFSNAFDEVASCEPVVTVEVTCIGATIDVQAPFIPTPEPAAAFRLAVDCAPSQAGIQSACEFPLSTTELELAVVLENTGNASAIVAGFNLIVEGAGAPSLTANVVPCAPPGANCNPDGNETAFGVPPECGPPYPIADVSSDPGSQSLISCFNAAGQGISLAPGTFALLATVSYTVSTTAGDETISLLESSLGDEAFSLVGSCNPVVDNTPMACEGAMITFAEPPTPTPTPAPSDLIVQSMTYELSSGSSCNFAGSTLGIRATVRNQGSGNAGSFVVDVDGSQQTVPSLAAGATTQVFFTLPYAGTFTAMADATFLVSESNEANNTLMQFVPIPTLPPTCTPSATATLTVTPTPTATQTPTATATSTTVVGPGIAKIPEGNANNVDLDVPAANLWICETGPCAGLGEGALRVVERATGVIEELGAYEFSVEYDNFVIQSVNPCDLVFGPGGAGSGRGPVDELNSSAVNPDCAPDPNNPANGSCAMSLVLENLVHFGCVTSGQAAGPTGDFDLASLLLIPHPDLNNDLFPGNNNGVLTVLKDNGCELVDVFGHPVSGSINGGLTPFCRDLAVTVRILEGDLDLDCDVDLTDAQAIASRYGAFFGGLLYSKWFDLEPQFHDLDIDIKDVQKVFGRQESTCQNPIPAQPPVPPPTAFGD